jgi:NDP-sugar pyrophosphorylase family protein
LDAVTAHIIGSILFAAGGGTRLRPITDAVSKAALPMLDVPLGAWGLRTLLGAAPPTVANVSHLADTVVTALSPHAGRDRLEFMVERPDAFGTAGTLAALEERVAGRVVTCNADLLSDLEAAELVLSHERLGAPATVAIKEVDAGADLEVSGDGAARLIDRREDRDTAGGLFLGMAVFEDSALGLIPAERPLDLTRGLLGPLIDRGQLAVHRHSGYAVDVGTPGRYLASSLDLLDGTAPSCTDRPPGKVIAVPGGSAYVGPEAVVEPESLADGAILLGGSIVRSDAVVSRSIVWRGEVVTRGTTLRDSIWIGGAELPAIGDLRADDLPLRTAGLRDGRGSSPVRTPPATPASVATPGSVRKANDPRGS